MGVGRLTKQNQELQALNDAMLKILKDAVRKAKIREQVPLTEQVATLDITSMDYEGTVTEEEHLQMELLTNDLKSILERGLGIDARVYRRNVVVIDLALIPEYVDVTQVYELPDTYIETYPGLNGLNDYISDANVEASIVTLKSRDGQRNNIDVYNKYYKPVGLTRDYTLPDKVIYRVDAVQNFPKLQLLPNTPQVNLEGLFKVKAPAKLFGMSLRQSQKPKEG
ncbi:hypothetical protein SPFM1_00082 [Salmonella phage SPFM1]|nr:hypothetical protein SPFM1_00082 [Salmonella phage SPFM1]